MKLSHGEKAIERENVTPFVGVWIETSVLLLCPNCLKVTPFVGVWIETLMITDAAFASNVTPFVGVWIETHR